MKVEGTGSRSVLEKCVKDNLQKHISNDLNLHLVNIKTYTKFDQILSICSQDTERK